MGKNCTDIYQNQQCQKIKERANKVKMSKLFILQVSHVYIF